MGLPDGKRQVVLVVQCTLPKALASDTLSESQVFNRLVYFALFGGHLFGKEDGIGFDLLSKRKKHFFRLALQDH